jgi:hypothetical protein
MRVPWMALAKALASLYDVEGAITSASGHTVQGRDALEKGFAEGFAGTSKGSRMTAIVGTIRFLKPDIAVVEGIWESLPRRLCQQGPGMAAGRGPDDVARARQPSGPRDLAARSVLTPSEGETQHGIRWARAGSHSPKVAPGVSPSGLLSPTSWMGTGTPPPVMAPASRAGGQEPLGPSRTGP